MSQIRPEFAAIRRKMEADGLPELLIRGFARYHADLVEGHTGLIAESAIHPVDALPDLNDLGELENAGGAALPRCVMLKLNGGLGTGMGLNQAKSLLPARAGVSFLELIVRQVLALRRRHAARLPLLLMNSFSTEADSARLLERFPDLADGQAPIPVSFLQHRVPRLDAETLQPIHWPADPAREWCPPGHGDLYTALLTTGLLDQLRDGGYRYLFASNADNLGASLDLRILGLMAERGLPFIMEVTDRTAADRKGGHLARRADGGLILRESAQCPEANQDHFQDINRHRYFNTNNIWIDLDTLSLNLRERDGLLGLPLIRNRKTVDPNDPASPAVIQVETAMGAAIEIFSGAAALRVPRSRFAPVKTTDDLLVLWSDRYDSREDGELRPTTASPILVRLDPRHYRSIEDFRQRFPRGAPSLRKARSLQIEGDIRFDADVIVRGDVALRHVGPGQRIIPAGSLLEDVRETGI